MEVFEEPPKKIGSRVRLSLWKNIEIEWSTYMQSKPRLSANLLVILVKIPVNLLVKPLALNLVLALALVLVLVLMLVLGAPRFFFSTRETWWQPMNINENQWQPIHTEREINEHQMGNNEKQMGLKEHQWKSATNLWESANNINNDWNSNEKQMNIDDN